MNTEVFKSREACKQLIVDAVESLQGAKATELAARPEVVLPLANNGFDFVELLEELIAQGRVVELEYVLHDMDWRCKSMIFPVGTTIYEPIERRMA